MLSLKIVPCGVSSYWGSSTIVWSAKFLPLGPLVGSMGLIECWVVFMECVVGVLVVEDSS